MGEPPAWGTLDAATFAPGPRSRRAAAVEAVRLIAGWVGTCVGIGLFIMWPALEEEGLRDYLVGASFVGLSLAGLLGLGAGAGYLFARRRARRESGVLALEATSRSWEPAPVAWDLRPDGTLIVAAGRVPPRPGDLLRLEATTADRRPLAADARPWTVPGERAREKVSASFVRDGRVLLLAGRTSLQVVDTETLRAFGVSGTAAHRRFRLDQAVEDVRADLGRLAVSERSLLAVFDLHTGSLLRTFGTLTAEGRPWLFGFAPSGPSLAVVTGETTVQVWDTDHDRVRLTLEHGPGGAGKEHVSDLAFSPDGSLLATAGVGRKTGTVRLWELEMGTVVASVPHPGKEKLTTRFSPSGRLLVGWDPFGHVQVRVWDVPTGTLRAEVAHPVIVRMVTVSPDDSLLATTDSDQVTRVWQLPGGELIGRLQHSHPPKRSAFTPDCGTLVTAGDADVTAVHVPRPHRTSDATA